MSLVTDSPDRSLQRLQWGFDAALAAFGATTGALLAFGVRRAGALAPFATVGRRVAREIALPVWGDAVVGLVVHFGEMLFLGLLMAALMHTDTRSTRLRSALVVVLAWQLVAPWHTLAVVRADVAADLVPISRVGLAVLLAAALAFGPRRAETARVARADPQDA